ncbi:MAG: redox-regulated ATPase YchF [Nitrospirae bacterium]|nr:MAG: redox-regulated ATPase YchF [Nitrospirota bacterium]
MGLSCGIIGLPNVGKTSVFNALVGGQGLVANYPFSTVESNVGVSVIPDPRLSVLAEKFRSKKVTPGTLEVRDIAGLVQGASRGEGLGNQFLGQIREVDALLHLVRCFDDPEVVHVPGEVDPVRDVAIIENELILADLAIIERRRERLEKRLRTGDAAVKKELDVVSRVESLLAEGCWLSGRVTDPEEQKRLKDYQLLTAKPVVFVANVSEDAEPDDPVVQAVLNLARERQTSAIVLAGKVEAEVASLPASEREEFFQALGMNESGLQRLMAVVNDMLGLITFFTAGEEEARAWTIRKHTTAREAAGKIHSDMQRGFIRAEVFAFEDLVACGTLAAVKEKGLFRLEGRDYVIQDGDVVYFRFNV